MNATTIYIYYNGINCSHPATVITINMSILWIPLTSTSCFIGRYSLFKDSSKNMSPPYLAKTDTLMGIPRSFPIGRVTYPFSSKGSLAYWLILKMNTYTISLNQDHPLNEPSQIEHKTDASKRINT